jgi:ankyrin repeat protein
MFLRLQRAWESPENAGEVSRYWSVVFTTASPLCAAAACNFEHVLRFLLVNEALVDGIPSLHFIGNPLLRAIRYGNEGIVRVLIELGANINIRTVNSASTVLTSIGGSGAELVNHLLEDKKIDTNMLDTYGRTIVSDDLDRLDLS